MGESTGRQSVRQAARRAALDAQAQLRAQRQERDKRLAALAMDVLVALGQRDAAVTTCEQRAGAALRKLIEYEHLTAAEVAQWCGPSLTRREVARLRRIGQVEQSANRNHEPATVTASVPDAASSAERPEQ